MVAGMRLPLFVSLLPFTSCRFLKQLFVITLELTIVCSQEKKIKKLAFCLVFFSGEVYTSELMLGTRIYPDVGPILHYIQPIVTLFSKGTKRQLDR